MSDISEQNIYLFITVIVNALIVIKCLKYNDKFKI